MATYTTSLRLAQPQVGADTNTWGTTLNTDWSLVDAAIASRATVNIAGLTTYTLTANNGASDEARAPIYLFTGALTGNCTVTLPAVTKFGYAINATSGGHSVILTNGAGATVTLGDAYWHFFFSDGTDVSQPTQYFNTVYGNNITGATLVLTGSAAAVNGVFSGTVQGATISATSSMSLTGTFTHTVAALGNTFTSFNVTGTGEVGTITSTGGGGTAYNTTSDYRLKVVLGPYDAGSAIDAVPVHFGHYKRDPGVSRALFLAHEVAEALPWAVTGGKDAIRDDGGIQAQMLDHASLVPVLWAAVRDLRLRVAELERR